MKTRIMTKRKEKIIVQHKNLTNFPRIQWKNFPPPTKDVKRVEILFTRIIYYKKRKDKS